VLNNLDSLNRAELEALYRTLLSTIVILARLLGYPCPVVTREERRSAYMRLDK
jgi:hypothetical protein